MASIFADIAEKTFSYKFHADLLVFELHGGIPTDPKKAEGWIRSKLYATDDTVRRMVAQTMLERGVDVEALPDSEVDQAIEDVVEMRQLNGFKRLEDVLCIEGRQVKAMLKEAASIAVAGGHVSARGWGKTNKGMINFLAEHIFVAEDKIPLGVVEPSGISQRFVHTWRGSGIQYEEYVTDAKVGFTVLSDHDFGDKFWKMMWVLAEKNGLGASRSTGVGTFEVHAWDRL